MDVVGQKITFSNGVEAINRTLKSAMTERLCTWGIELNTRGHPTDEYTHLYKLVSKKLGPEKHILPLIICFCCSGAKDKSECVYLETFPVMSDIRKQRATCVWTRKPVQRILQKSSSQQFRPLRHMARWPSFSSRMQGTCRFQISALCLRNRHCRRQTPDFIAPTPVSASETQSPSLGGMTFGHARALTIEEIEDIVRRFAWAAKKSQEAGADGVQVIALAPQIPFKMYADIRPSSIVLMVISVVSSARQKSTSALTDMAGLSKTVPGFCSRSLMPSRQRSTTRSSC